MYKRLFRRGLVAVSACSLALVTATTAHATSAPGWQIADVLGPAGGVSEVTGVAATGAQDGWAAGSYCGSPCSSPNEPEVMVAQWNGTAWQQVSLPTSITNGVPNASNAAVGASSATNAWVFSLGTGTGSKGASTDYTYAPGDGSSQGAILQYGS
jgi:shikimate kinase